MSAEELFFLFALNCVQSIPFCRARDCCGGRRFVAFLVCLFLHKQFIRASLSPKPDQNELVSPSACDPFAKSLLRL